MRMRIKPWKSVEGDKIININRITPCMAGKHKSIENEKEAVDFIVGEELMEIGCKENLQRLYDELLKKDWFMTLLDYEDYVRVREQAYKDYENRMEWAKKMLVNISKAGFFSSDRTIEEYNRDIWKLS